MDGSRWKISEMRAEEEGKAIKDWQSHSQAQAVNNTGTSN